MDLFFAELNSAFEALLKCYEDLVARVRGCLLEAFDIRAGNPNWRHLLSNRAEAIVEAVGDPWLKAVLMRARDRSLPETQYVESIAAAVVNQPPHQWMKAEEDEFGRAVQRLNSAIQAAEASRELESVLGPGENGYIISIIGRGEDTARRVVRHAAEEEPEIDRMVDGLARAVSATASYRVKLAAIAELARRVISEGDEKPADLGETH